MAADRCCHHNAECWQVHEGRSNVGGASLHIAAEHGPGAHAHGQRCRTQQPRPAPATPPPHPLPPAAQTSLDELRQELGTARRETAHAAAYLKKTEAAFPPTAAPPSQHDGGGSRSPSPLIRARRATAELRPLSAPPGPDEHLPQLLSMIQASSGKADAAGKSVVVLDGRLQALERSLAESSESVQGQLRALAASCSGQRAAHSIGAEGHSSSSAAQPSLHAHFTARAGTAPGCPPPPQPCP